MWELYINVRDTDYKVGPQTMMALVVCLNLIEAAFLRPRERHFAAISSVCGRDAYCASNTGNSEAGLNTTMFTHDRLNAFAGPEDKNI